MESNIDPAAVSLILEKVESLMEDLEKIGDIGDDPCYDPFRKSWWKASDIRTMMVTLLEHAAGEDEGPM